MGTQEAVWTQKDLQHLLSRIKTCIPARETDSGYSRTTKFLDWKKIAFDEYSPEECQAKWRKMFLKMRKLRTMTELIEEAEIGINNPFMAKKHIHPDYPSKPPHQHSLYLKENKEALKKQHPDLNQQELLALVYSSYKNLPAHKKEEYSKKYQVLREKYDQDIIQLRQRYDKPAQKKKGFYAALKRKVEEQDDLDAATSTQPTTSPASKKRKDVELCDQPPTNGFMLFVDEQRAASEPVTLKDHLSNCSQRWKKLRQAERDSYSALAMELKRQYGSKLKTFISSLTKEKTELIKEDLEMLCRQAKKYSKTRPVLFPGEPKKPSWTGISVFCSEKMAEVRGDARNPRDKLASINSTWATLSAEVQAPYCKKGAIKFHRYTLDVQEWFRTLSADDQADYLNKKPRNAKYVVTWDLEPKERYVASDSEDEDYLDCHRSNDPEGDDDDDNADDEEEEEEEQGNEGALWTHEKLAKPAGRAVETSDSDTHADC